MIDDRLTGRVIGLAVDVHRRFGPGLFESVYETFLCAELEDAGIPFARQAPIAAEHNGRRVDLAFRADLIVASDLIVEIKSVEALAPVHEAQLLTYLRLSRCRVGLLLNFNTVVLRHGLRRFVNSLGRTGRVPPDAPRATSAERPSTNPEPKAYKN